VPVLTTEVLRTFDGCWDVHALRARDEEAVIVLMAGSQVGADAAQGVLHLGGGGEAAGLG
jgi:hypothetical protein